MSSSLLITCQSPAGQIAWVCISSDSSRHCWISPILAKKLRQRGRFHCSTWLNSSTPGSRVTIESPQLSRLLPTPQKSAAYGRLADESGPDRTMHTIPAENSPWGLGRSGERAGKSMTKHGFRHGHGNSKTFSGPSLCVARSRVVFDNPCKRHFDLIPETNSSESDQPQSSPLSSSTKL